MGRRRRRRRKVYSKEEEEVVVAVEEGEKKTGCSEKVVVSWTHRRRQDTLCPTTSFPPLLRFLRGFLSELSVSFPYYLSPFRMSPSAFLGNGVK